MFISNQPKITIQLAKNFFMQVYSPPLPLPFPSIQMVQNSFFWELSWINMRE